MSTAGLELPYPRVSLTKFRDETLRRGKYIPNFRRQPGHRSRLKCVYGFIMELVSFSSIILKLIMISLLCKRLLILHYLTNVHMYFLFIFVDNILVLFSHNWKYPLFL